MSEDATSGPIRVARIISRLNIGGPAIQVITLTQQLDELGYATTLYRGREDRAEGSMDDLAAQIGVVPRMVPGMRRGVGRGDGLSLPWLVSQLRRQRPHIIHTHAAKAGAIGRTAAIAAFPRRRPILIHTYHGHSLRGYFNSRREQTFLRIERELGTRTDRLVAVSPEVRDDLVDLGVASADRFSVVPLGFDLTPFVVADRERERTRIREEFSIAPNARVVTLVARLVPIKRVDRFLRVASRLSTPAGTRLLIVGDGELRPQLHEQAAALGLRDHVVWAGFRRDMPSIYAASDVVVLTSDNEGTPVSLIEAHAAGLPVVSTDVGGVRSVVTDGETGILVDCKDELGLAAAVSRLLADRDTSRRFGERGREAALARFGLDRLVSDVDGLYREMLARHRGG